MDSLTTLMASTDKEDIKLSIETIRLEIERLRLENENLKLKNENLRLRTLSSNTVLEESSSEPSLEDDSIIPEVTNEEDDNELENLLKIDIINSSIQSCTINETISFSNKELNYTTILRKIWEQMPRQTIYDSSTFHCKDYHYSKHGYKWLYEIQLSIKMGNTKEILNEMIHCCKLMKFTLKMDIQLKNTNIITIHIKKNENDNVTLSYDVTFVKQPHVQYVYKNSFGGYYIN